MIEKTDNQPQEGKSPNENKANLATKRIQIDIPESLHNQFEGIRMSEENPIGKRNFFSNVFKNGIEATERLVQINQPREGINNAETNNTENTEKEPLPVKIKKEFPFWLKIVGSAIISILVFLGIRSMFFYEVD